MSEKIKPQHLHRTGILERFAAVRLQANGPRIDGAASAPLSSLNLRLLRSLGEFKGGAARGAAQWADQTGAIRPRLLQAAIQSAVTRPSLSSHPRPQTSPQGSSDLALSHEALERAAVSHKGNSLDTEHLCCRRR